MSHSVRHNFVEAEEKKNIEDGKHEEDNADAFCDVYARNLWYTITFGPIYKAKELIINVFVEITYAKNHKKKIERAIEVMIRPTEIRRHFNTVTS